MNLPPKVGQKTFGGIFMTKHHDELTKRRAIDLYTDGKSGIAIARELSVAERVIHHWLRSYREHGEKSFVKQRYSKCSYEIKSEVVGRVLEKRLSCEQVALDYGISESAVRCWLRKVRSDGYESLSQVKPRGRPPKPMGRPRKKEPQTELEKLELENARLKAENALLKKVQALVEERVARQRAIGQKRSKN